MFSTFAKAGLAALIALGGISVTAPAASAGSDVQFRVQVQDGYGHRPGWGRPDRPRRGCSPWLAEEKASRRVFAARVLLMYLRAASSLQVLTATAVTASYSLMSAAAR